MKDNLVDGLHQNGMFYFVLGSLISSDSILCKEDAEKAIESLKKLEGSSLSTRMKNKYKSKIKECYEVLNSDLERFQE